MLNNIVIGRYYNTNSLIHKMNPLAKIICVFTYLLITIINNNIFISLLMLLTSLVALVISNIPIGQYIKSISSLKLFILFIIIINIIFGVNLIIIVKQIFSIIGIVIYTSVLTFSTAISEITYGLNQFLLPLKFLKIPINKISLTISMVLRFIPFIIEQANKILKSIASRGIDYNSSDIKGKFLAVKSMITPMFVLTIKKADNLSDSMEVRLFNLNNNRSNYQTNKWDKNDSIIVIFHITLFGVLVVKDVFYAIFNNFFI